MHILAHTHMPGFSSSFTVLHQLGLLSGGDVIRNICLVSPWNFLSDGVRGAFFVIHNKRFPTTPEVINEVTLGGWGPVARGTNCVIRG